MWEQAQGPEGTANLSKAPAQLGSGCCKCRGHPLEAGLPVRGPLWARYLFSLSRLHSWNSLVSRHSLPKDQSAKGKYSFEAKTWTFHFHNWLLNLHAPGLQIEGHCWTKHPYGSPVVHGGGWGQCLQDLEGSEGHFSIHCSWSDLSAPGPKGEIGSKY